MEFSLDQIRHIIGECQYEYWPKTHDDFIDTRYSNHHEQFGHSWYYYRLFYQLSRQLNPNLVVELGGWQGTAAAHFASGNRDTQVITIDHHTDPGDEYHQTLMMDAVNRYPNLKYIQGWTTEMLATREKGNHQLGDAPNAYPQVAELNQPIDILFVDSWHRYDEAMSDWNTYSQILAKPSLVICDDIQEGGDEHSPIYRMFEFWQELPGEKFLSGDLHPGSNMGFIRYA